MSTFDYTSRDYAAIQSDLLRRAQTQLPEWTSREPSDFGMVMVDLWSYMGDILHYYVDRAAGEAFLQTATQRESVLAIANLLDYVPAGRRAATATIQLDASLTTATDTSPIYLPKYTRFLASPLLSTASPVVFTLNNAIAFVSTSSGASTSIVHNGASYTPYVKTTPLTVAVTEGEVFTETYSSTGLSGQQITLRNTGVVTGSIDITVNEGPASSAVQYTYVPRLISATNSANVFGVDVTADNYSVVTFGNSVNGHVPVINSTITITYRRSRGAAGNVLSKAIDRIESTTVPNSPSLDGLIVIANTAGALGGTDTESISSMKANIPAAFRSQDRAVSLQDYMDIVKRVPGIVKATAWVNGSTVEIRAAVPTATYGSSNMLVLDAPTVTSIEEYLAPREIAYASSNVGASLSLTPIHLVAALQVLNGFVKETVREAVVAAVSDLFSFDNVDIDSTVSLGAVYRAALAVPGVDYFTVSRFTITGSTVIDTSGNFVGVTPTIHTMLVKSLTSTFTITATGGITATVGA